MIIPVHENTIQLNSTWNKQMASINYSQQEKDVIARLQVNEIVALNIKRIKAAKNAPDSKNFSIEIRQKLPNLGGNGSSSFNVNQFMNPDVFTSSSGVRVAWMSVNAEQAISLFGINSGELDNLPIDGGQSRVFIGKMAPSFTVPDGSVKVLQLQKVEVLASNQSLTDYDRTHLRGENGRNATAKRVPNGRWIMGLNKTTGEIEHIVSKTQVKSATLQPDGSLVNDAWDHIMIDEYMDETQPQTAVQTIAQTIAQPESVAKMLDLS